MSSSAERDLYERANAELSRALLAWWRGLWRRREPRVEEAQVVAFPADATRSNPGGDRDRFEAV